MGPGSARALGALAALNVKDYENFVEEESRERGVVGERVGPALGAQPAAEKPKSMGGEGRQCANMALTWPDAPPAGFEPATPALGELVVTSPSRVADQRKLIAAESGSPNFGTPSAQSR